MKVCELSGKRQNTHTHYVCVSIQEERTRDNSPFNPNNEEIARLKVKLMMISCIIWGLESSKPTNLKVCCKNLIWLVSFEGET